MLFHDHERFSKARDRPDIGQRNSSHWIRTITCSVIGSEVVNMAVFRLTNLQIGLALLFVVGAHVVLAQDDDLGLEAVGEGSQQSSSASGKGPQQPSSAGGKGDPLMEAFDGTLFFFTGISGHIYNLASDPGFFQISALMKEANNAEHLNQNKNGTYMQALDVNVLGTRVRMETFSDDSAKLVVKVNGEDLLMDPAGEVSKELTMSDASRMSVQWSLWLAPHGTTVKITTDIISVTAYLVPPGLDSHKMWQPSYLNLNLTLNRPPKGDIQGIIGDTYHYKPRDTAGTADTNLYDAPVTSFVNDVYPVFPEFSYELQSFDSPPRYSFTHHFVHHLIKMRKEAAEKQAKLVMPTASA
eukprot:jgi/Botrbrau1/19174/Bobra.0077s0083.1